MTFHKIKKTAIALLSAALLATAAPALAAPAAAAAQKQEQLVLHITYNGFERTLSYPLLITPGRVWMGVYDLGDAVQDYRREVDDKSGTVIFTSPWRRIELHVGSKTADINGNKISLSAAPLRKHGIIYLPVQVLTKLMNQGVQWDTKQSRLTVRTETRVLSVGGADSWFWVDKLYGNIYKAKPKQHAVKIARTTKDLRYASELQIDILGNDKHLLRMMDGYAEPHIITKLLVNQNQLVHEAKVQYKEKWYVPGIERAGEDLLMINGRKLAVVSPEGFVSAEYNMQELGGADEDYVVEALYDDALLLRTYSSRTLRLIDLNTKKKYLLGQELLSEEEQKAIESSNAYGYGFQGDQLTLTGRKGDQFTFKHRSLLAPFDESTLTFTLPRESAADS
ncbi:copper amine oxidase N-terminal domain-containing protein [Paenibacillus nasutitermitis]|uniref:Copper amine oxidase-like N-terminal domain-containing protein n=1 Tax=Paenibacillus nasutitermitis TaxID=1652958 RepID=A0A917E0V7_9BACL|nr:copper amine oxidase N-terminal domain-containing protein [Paenibacillus nasutitermitis]GGD86238.1 hypothetical protein GCM10010911_50820 [Paenibacillus nasutitermitis]